MRPLRSIRSHLRSRSGIVFAVLLIALLGTATLAFAAPSVLGVARDEPAPEGDQSENPAPPPDVEKPGPNDERDSGEEDQGTGGPPTEEPLEDLESGRERVEAQATATCMGEPATMEGTAENDQIDGTDDRDVIVAGEGNDTVRSRGGDDVVCGGDGDGRTSDDFVDDDDIRAGSGDDRVDGQLGNDRIRGDDGDDTLFGDEGESGEQTTFFSTSDDIDGGDGDDVLDGGEFQDLLLGGDGSDSIESVDDGSIDVVIGGRSSDQCNADDDDENPDRNDDVSECEGDDTVETPDSNEADGGGSSGGGGGSGGGNGNGNGRGHGNGNDGDDSNGGAGATVGAALPPFCLPRTASVGALGMGSLFLGGNVLQTLVGAGQLPLPLSPPRSLSFCVDGGGVTLVAFSPIGRAEVILSTGPGQRARQVNTGDPVSAIRRSYPNALRIGSPATHSGARLYRASPRSRIIFGVRNRRVVFVGLSSRAALADDDLLAQYLRQIPLPRGT